MKLKKKTSTVPLPPKRMGQEFKYQKHQYQIPHSVLTDAVRKLEVGQSFKVEASDPRALQRRMAGAIGGSYIEGNVLFKRRFSIRQVGDGVRVWRKI